MEESFFGRVFRGYAGLLKGLGFLAALVGASAALGFLASWPLWLFATKSRAAYSVICLSALGAGCLSLIVRAVIRGRSGRRGAFLSMLLVAAWVVIFALGLYGIILLVARGSILWAAPFALLLILVLGWLAYMASSRRRPPRG